MSFSSVLVFAVPVLIGILAVHLFWSERTPWALLLKLCLGAGIGLGLSSFLYFLLLTIMPGRLEMMRILIPALVILLGIVFIRERSAGPRNFSMPKPSGIQLALTGVALVVLAVTALTFVRLTQSRPQGAFDAWSIWNRAARFIYLDPQNWQATLSPKLYWGMHADYPLLLPLNVAWGWETLDDETLRIPMVHGLIFTLGSFGLLYAAVALLRSVGQAALASLSLMATSTFVLIGSGLISDVPLAFYMLAASVLLYLFFANGNPRLLALSGFMAGLAGWSKNEGLMFIVVSLGVLAFAATRDGLRTLAWYLAGLAFPMAVILYFKLALAPPGDLFTDTGAVMLSKATDPSRYALIIKNFIGQLFIFPGWPFSIVLQLLVYALILRIDTTSQPPDGIRAIAAIVLFQFFGYCAIYVLTPQDLGWHLGTSFGRLMLHIYPTALFLFFCVVSMPEKYLKPALESKGAG